MLFLLGSLLAASPNATSISSRQLQECGQPFAPCLESKCCHGEPTWGCHKRQGRAFAQCRRVPESGCTSDATYQCPGEWEECTTGSHQECWESMCCSVPSEVCMKRNGRNYAQCRPMRDCEAAGSDWLCPGTWTNPHAGGRAGGNSPPPPRACSEPFQPCTDTHCCTGNAFHCIEKKNRFFAQCIRPESCVADATHACNDVEGTQPYSPPPPPPAVVQHGGGGGGGGGQTVRNQGLPPRPVTQRPAGVSPAGGGGGGLTLFLVFFVAVALGVGGVFGYLKYARAKLPWRLVGPPSSIPLAPRSPYLP